MTGPDLPEFVNGRHWPYLAGSKQPASGPNTTGYKIVAVFGDILNTIQRARSGDNLRDVIELVDAQKTDLIKK